MTITDLLPTQIQPFYPLIQGVVSAVGILIVTWLASKWANALTLGGLRKTKVDEALSRFLAPLVQYAVLAAGVIAALGRVGIQTTSLVAIFASAGLAIGLALQGSLSSFASGVMLLIFRPFQLGDFVVAGGHTGSIEEIGIFTTSMRAPDNEVIILPNASITSGPIINYTKAGHRRGQIVVGVAYGSGIDQVQGLLEQALKETEHVMEEPAPVVLMTGLAASSVEFTLYPWAQVSDYRVMMANVRKAAYDTLNEAEIEIPFDQIVVHNAA